MAGDFLAYFGLLVAYFGGIAGIIAAKEHSTSEQTRKSLDTILAILIGIGLLFAFLVFTDSW